MHEALIVFRQLDVKLFGGYIACYIGLFVCMRLKMSMKQVTVKGLCMKLPDFFRQLDVKLFGGYIAYYTGVFVCMRLKMSMKQVIVKGLCMEFCLFRGMYMCVEGSLKQSISNGLCMKFSYFEAAWCRALSLLSSKPLHDTLHDLINIHGRLLF